MAGLMARKRSLRAIAGEPPTIRPDILYYDENHDVRTFHSCKVELFPRLGIIAARIRGLTGEDRLTVLPIGRIFKMEWHDKAGTALRDLRRIEADAG